MKKTIFSFAALLLCLHTALAMKEREVTLPPLSQRNSEIEESLFTISQTSKSDTTPIASISPRKIVAVVRQQSPRYLTSDAYQQPSPTYSQGSAHLQCSPSDIADQIEHDQTNATLRLTAPSMTEAYPPDIDPCSSPRLMNSYLTSRSPRWRNQSNALSQMHVLMERLLHMVNILSFCQEKTHQELLKLRVLVQAQQQPDDNHLDER